MIGFLLIKPVGVSLIFGGILGMYHFRSLHRMFQRRIIDPAARLNSQFYYSLKLFTMVALFFWAVQSSTIRPPFVIIGFLLTTAAILLDGKRV